MEEMGRMERKECGESVDKPKSMILV